MPTLRYERQKYRDHTFGTDIIPQHCTFFQPKYDGIWCCADVADGQITYFSRSGNIKLVKDVPTAPNGVFIGELMYGSQWSKQNDRAGKLYLFDILELNSRGLDRETYARRYQILWNMREYLPPNWQMATNHPVSDLPAFWQNQVLTNQMEGVVIRNPNDTYYTELLRAKFSATIDLRVIGFEAGKGKHAGTLGALVCVRTDRALPKIRVGGGFTDRERRTIWENQTKFFGRVLEVEHKKEFDSGSLRHPNFVKWRSD